MDFVSKSIFEQKTGLSPFQFLEYLIKCIIGVTITFLLFLIFPQFRDQLYWVIISVMLSITHDNDSKAATDRMKGNMVGSVVGLIGYFLDFLVKKGNLENLFKSGNDAPSIILIIIGVIITITICTFFGIVSVRRTALVAFFIVMIYEDDHHSYQGALMRMIATVLGCLLGLIINKCFSWLTNKIFVEWFGKNSKKTEEDNVY